MNQRDDYNSPAYKAWRWQILKRDNYTCSLCGNKGGELECHHILKYANFPKLRYVISNGICLCKRCHQDLVTNREDEYIEKFQKIIALKKIEQGAKSGKTTYQSNQSLYKRKWKPENPYRRY